MARVKEREQIERAGWFKGSCGGVGKYFPTRRAVARRWR